MKRGPYKKTRERIAVQTVESERAKLASQLLQLLALHPHDEYVSPKGYRFLRINRAQSILRAA